MLGKTNEFFIRVKMEKIRLKLKAYDHRVLDRSVAAIVDAVKRTGAEIRLRPISFRAGLAHYGSPFVDELNDGSFWVASAGIGYRDRVIFVDLGASYSIKSEDYYMYNPDLIAPASVDYHSVRLALTMGYKF